MTSPAAAGGTGMMGVETIARVRLEHYQNGKGIKRIARELGLSCQTASNRDPLSASKRDPIKAWRSKPLAERAPVAP